MKYDNSKNKIRTTWLKYQNSLNKLEQENLKRQIIKDKINFKNIDYISKTHNFTTAWSTIPRTMYKEFRVTFEDIPTSILSQFINYINFGIQMESNVLSVPAFTNHIFRIDSDTGEKTNLELIVGVWRIVEAPPPTPQIKIRLLVDVVNPQTYI